jgi:hypothetical protein
MSTLPGQRSQITLEHLHTIAVLFAGGDSEDLTLDGPLLEFTVHFTLN